MPSSRPTLFRSLRFQIALLLAALLTVLWAGIHQQNEQDREQSFADAEREQHNLARAFSEQVQSSVRAIDLTLLTLREDWRRNPSAFHARVQTQQDMLTRDLLFQFAVIDAQGGMVYSSLDPQPKPLDLSDREHFRIHRERGTDELFISKPLLGRVSNRWSIQFTRPIRDERGRFAGVVVLSAAPELFSRFYETINIGDQGIIVLTRRSGEILARSPNPEQALGKTIVGTPYLKPDAAETGVFRRVAQIDGIERQYAWRKLPHADLTVVTGMSVDTILRDARRSERHRLLGGTLLSLALLLFGAFNINNLRLRAQTAARLEASETRYRTLVSSLAEGVLLVGHDGCVLAANPSAESILELPAERLLGANLLDPAGLALLDNDGNPLTIDDSPLPRLIQSDRSVDTCTFGLRTPGGKTRWLRASSRPLAETPEEIPQTVLSLLDISREHTDRETLLLSAAVIENAAEGVMVTDARGVIRMVNPAFSTITGYSADELIGNTPGILRSGRHGPAFYAAMWKMLEREGHWSGEIWNRRKNGQTYPEWLTISPVRDEEGVVRYHVGLFSDITERKQREQRMWQQANFDALTELPNRAHFIDRLDTAVAEARRSRSPLALLFIDLDHFKWINDTLGHDAGNQLLREAAQRMRAGLREEDLAARLSGDEFAVLLPTIKRNEDADLVAGKLLAALASAYRLAGREVFVSASIGISTFPVDGENGAGLLKNADAAMYRAKESGRNQFAYFTPQLHERAEHRLRLGSELRRALQDGQFELYYQPIVAGDGRLAALEALLRWNHPQRGIVLPGEFIETAEEVGLIHELGNWLLPQALRQLNDWQERYGFDGSLAINLSSVEFRNRAHLEELLACIAQAAPPAGSLTLEITETSLLSGEEAVNDFLARACELGVHIALDDFGTGYSSLSYLKRFPFTIVKIDQQFVRGLPDTEKDLAMVDAIVAMARRMKLTIVAEGVETSAQRDYLTSIGCNRLQGFMIAKPMPAGELAARYFGEPAGRAA